MKGLCTHLARTLSDRQHVVAANEGSAIGIAVGHYLATGRPALVYMQNAGLGNAINPLLSLACKGVYGVPMVLIIGWRGQPGQPDEPQHLAQGEATLGLLKVMNIPVEILADASTWRASVSEAASHAISERNPVALLLPRGALSPPDPEDLQPPPSHIGDLTRSGLVLQIVEAVRRQDALLVVSTGFLSRDVAAYREVLGEEGRDFLTVGGMGHASQVALGAALARPDLEVVCLDGDGAALMHLGGLATIAQLEPPNLLHVVANNGRHESVGGQPTTSPSTRFAEVARELGYRHSAHVTSATDLSKALDAWPAPSGPFLIEALLGVGGPAPLGRPLIHPRDRLVEIRTRFGGR
jgi:phosphonopyruvate decarboxylase